MTKEEIKELIHKAENISYNRWMKAKSNISHDSKEEAQIYRTWHAFFHVLDFAFRDIL